jgi:hypothetical protein
MLAVRCFDGACPHRTLIANRMRNVFFVSLGLVPIGRQSQPAFDRNAVPITTKVYPRRMMIRCWRARADHRPTWTSHAVAALRSASRSGCDQGSTRTSRVVAF